MINFEFFNFLANLEKKNLKVRACRLAAQTFTALPFYHIIFLIKNKSNFSDEKSLKKSVFDKHKH